MKLTETQILKLVCPEGKKDRLVKVDGYPNLYLRVGSKAVVGKLGARTYLFKKGSVKIPLEVSTLATAQTAAAKLNGDIAIGRDPAAERKAKALEARRAAAHVELTLAGLIDSWAKLHLAGKRSSYAYEAVRALNVAFAKHLLLPASDLDRATAVAAVDKLTIAERYAMAKSLVRYGSVCFGWAVKRGTLASNPFAAIPTAPTTKRDRVLTDDELRAIWQATAGPGSFNAIVRVLMLTGQREGEVAGMAWSELSADLAVWTLPASRAKNGAEHIVPLSAQAQAIIRAAPRYANRLCFPGNPGVFRGFHKAKQRLDEASGVDGWVLPDLRRTMATGLQKLGVRLEVTESVLNHVSGSRGGIVGVYQRHDWADEKRAALAAWGARVAAIVEGREVSNNNVVELRASA
jgi:integrase